MSPVSGHSRRLIGETLEFLRQTLRVGGAMFYWIDPALETRNDMIIGLPDGLADHYRRDMAMLDPLLAARLARAGKSVAELASEAAAMPPAHQRRYFAFLDDYGVTGNMDFLFWTGAPWASRAYGGLSLVRMRGDAPFPEDRTWLAALHRYVAVVLQSHDHVRAERLRMTLRQDMGLTQRECEICEWVALGMTNQDIAECLGLTIATVKSYLRRIFDKMGVETRTALGARMSRLQAS